MLLHLLLACPAAPNNIQQTKQWSIYMLVKLCVEYNKVKIRVINLASL